MNDDRETQAPDDAALDEALDSGEQTDGGKLDEYDDAIASADATGMVSAEQLITRAEIERGLRGE